MRVLQVYNQYPSPYAGEEFVVYDTLDLLKKRGVEAKLLMRSSRGLERSLRRKMRAFCSGIYNPSAYREMLRLLKIDRPDIVHIHNLYPLFSPSVLVACRRAGIPAVMTIHNFALTCPNWFHLHKGHICQRCIGGREYWCVLKNCTEDIFKSLAYALRTAVARKWRLFKDNVTLFIALSEFAKRRLIDAGFRKERIVVMPNMVSVPEVRADPARGKYIAYAGRLSVEKGVDTLLRAARKFPGLPVRLAGDGPSMAQLVAQAPKNAKFLGALNRRKLALFYRKARFVVVPSLCFESGSLVTAEAMSHGLPVIASRIGGLPEMVEDGVTGLLFEPGNAEDLALKMNLLWENPGLCRRMGETGREKAAREYNEEVYYKRLIALYEKAIEVGKGKDNYLALQLIQPSRRGRETIVSY